MKTAPLMTSILMASLGCSTIGDVIVPPHPRSDIRDDDAICVSFTPTSEREFAAALLLAPLAAPLAEIAIDQTSKAIAKESKRYKATYSGRTSDEIFVVAKVIKDTNNKGDTTERVVPGLRLGGFSAKRIFGKATKTNGCSSELAAGNDPENMSTTAIKLTGNFEISSQLDAIRIVLTSFDMTHSKSKVAAARPLIPWSWWMYLDRSRGKVDVDVQVELSMVVDSKDGRKTISLGKIDFPVGKVKLHDGVKKNERQLQHLSSDWIPVPQIDAPKDYRVGVTAYGPINLSVTIIEADDLGDVIAKGSENLDNNKDKISEKTLQLLGLSDK